MLRPLLIAIQFMTRLPLPRGILKEADYTAEQLGRSVIMYPIVGLIIGAILAGAYLLLQAYAPNFNALINAALILLLWVWLTGALHLDGLSDSADAWVGGYGDRDKTLAIMKDPYCGPAGVTIIVLVLLLKFAALTSIDQQTGLYLILTPILARAAIIILFISTPYVRKEGIGAQHAAHLPKALAWLMLSSLILACIYLLKLKALWLFITLALAFLLLRYLMQQRLGGTTGDTAGALVEVIETVALLTLLAN